MNELPVIGSLRLCKDFWEIEENPYVWIFFAHRANIATR